MYRTNNSSLCQYYPLLACENCALQMSVVLMWCGQGGRSKGWVRGGVGPAQCKMRQVTRSKGQEQMGIRIHASKATTLSKAFVHYCTNITYIFLLRRFKINYVRELWRMCIYSWSFSLILNNDGPFCTSSCCCGYYYYN